MATQAVKKLKLNKFLEFIEMESRALLRHARVSARKARLVVDMVRGKDVGPALNALTLNKKKTAPIVAKLLRSAIANAEQKGLDDPDKLFIKKAFVDEGPTMKRFMPRAQGKSTRILKRTSHITVILAER